MKYKFSVPDMSCNHCKMRIEKVMKDSGKVKDLVIDLNSKVVAMDSDLSEEELINLFDKAGYDATKIG